MNKLILLLTKMFLVFLQNVTFKPVRVWHPAILHNISVSSALSVEATATMRDVSLQHYTLKPLPLGGMSLFSTTRLNHCHRARCVSSGLHAKPLPQGEKRLFSTTRLSHCHMAGCVFSALRV